MNLPARNLAGMTEQEQNALLEGFAGQLPKKVQAALSNNESVEISLTWPALNLTNVSDGEITVVLKWGRSALQKEGETRFDAAVDREKSTENTPDQTLLRSLFFSSWMNFTLV